MCHTMFYAAKSAMARARATWFGESTKMTGSQAADAISYLRKLARDGVLPQADVDHEIQIIADNLNMDAPR